MTNTANPRVKVDVNPLNAKTLIVYNVTLPYIPERNDKTSRYVVCLHDVHAHAYFQCFDLMHVGIEMSVHMNNNGYVLDCFVLCYFVNPSPISRPTYVLVVRHFVHRAAIVDLKKYPQ